MWMIRNPQGQHADILREKKVVGLGWANLENSISNAQKPEDFYAALKVSFPDYTDQQAVTAGRQLYKFYKEMKQGDTVITYDSPARVYLVGKISGDAQTSADMPEYLKNFRSVEWKAEVERDRLSQAARNVLGATLTIFKPAEEVQKEIEALAAGKEAPITLAEEVVVAETEDPYASAHEKSRELIKDKIIKLSWQDMQALVAGILRSMGYKTKISLEGSDRGKDVIASPDGLGLEQPRIFVEVKHRKGNMGAPEVRKFIGGRDPLNDRCLYVSTGGFTTEAKYEAERSKVPLTLVDIDDLVELLLDYYEEADTETRTLVPLRKTYWPA